MMWLLSGIAVACGSSHASDKPVAEGAGHAGTPDDGRGPSGEGGSGGAADTPEVTLPVIPGVAGELATSLVNAPDDDTAVALTQRVLAKLGVDVVNVAGDPIDPDAEVSVYQGLPAMPVQVYQLAVAARTRGSISVFTLADVGDMLAGFGFEHAPDVAPGDALVAAVAAWVQESLKAPDDPASFPALFLAALAQQQEPAVDLASGQARPDEVRLGLLDLEVLLSGTTRALRDADSKTGANQLSGGSKLLGAAAPVSDCSSLKESLGILGELGGIGVGKASDATQELFIEQALEKAGVESAKELTEAVTQFLSYLKQALKVVRLAQFYMNTQVEVTSDAAMTPVHRPATDDPERTIEYTAHVHIDADAYEKAKSITDAVHEQLMLKDCLDQLGIPLLPDASQLAADAENWRAQWSMSGGPHGYWDPAHAWTSKTYEDLLTRVSPSEVDDVVPVLLTKELGPGHRGTLAKDGQLTVTASVNASKPPSLETFVNAVSELPLAIADLSLGWFQTAVQPKASLTLPISYHYPYKGWRGHIRVELSAPEGQIYYEQRKDCDAGRDMLYLHKFKTSMEWQVTGSEASGLGNAKKLLPSFSNDFAAADVLHGSGSTMCLIHVTQSLKGADRCDPPSEEIKTAYAYNAVPLYDAAVPGAKATGGSPVAGIVAFDQAIGAPASEDPVQYIFPFFPTITCDGVNGGTSGEDGYASVGGTEITLNRGLLDTSLTQTDSEPVKIQFRFPNFAPIKGTWDPKDPDHIHGHEVLNGTDVLGVNGFMHSPTVGTTLTLDWDLRRYK